MTDQIEPAGAAIRSAEAAIVGERLSALDRTLSDKMRSLEELINSKLTAQEERVALAFDASQDAIIKAEAQMNKRLETMNEFREQLTMQAGTFVAREVFEASASEWSRWRASVDKFQYRIIGAVGLAMVLMPIVVGVIVFLLTRQAIPISK